MKHSGIVYVDHLICKSSVEFFEKHIKNKIEDILLNYKKNNAIFFKSFFNKMLFKDNCIQNKKGIKFIDIKKMLKRKLIKRDEYLFLKIHIDSYYSDCSIYNDLSTLCSIPSEGIYLSPEQAKFVSKMIDFNNSLS